MNPKSPKLQLFLLSAVLTLLIVIAFEPLRHNDFVNFDDPLYVTDNPHIQDGFTIESVKWAFCSGYASNWHPLTWLSHMADIELFGFDPLGHHLHSLLLHTAATILLLFIFYYTTGNIWCSVFVALAFGIHPLRVESVAWASERKDVLGALFWMLTIAAYLYYLKRSGLGRYLLVMLCFGLGLMAKPMLVTLPIVLVLLDYWPLKRFPKNQMRLFMEKIPLLVLALASCIITYLVQKPGGDINPIDLYTWFSNVIIAYLVYLGKIFRPHNLAVLYPYPSSANPLWLTAIALAAILGLSILAVRNRSKWPWFFTGWFWYLLTLIPVIGLVKVGNQFIADRYTYLPSIGIMILITWSAVQVSAKLRYPRIVVGIVLALTAAAMSIGTHRQTALWKDSVTLFTHTLAVTQKNAVIHNNIAWPLWTQGRKSQAAEHIRKALEIAPDYHDANISMAYLLFLDKKYDKAMEYICKILSVDPTHAKANLTMAHICMARKKFDEAQTYLHKVLTTDIANADAYYNLGIIENIRGQTDLADAAFRNAIKRNRNHDSAMCELGALKAQQELWGQAADWFHRSIHINPDNDQAHFNLGSVLQKQGKFEEAISSYLISLQIDPNNLNTWSNLASCRQTLGQLTQAVNSYDKVLQLEPNSLSALNNLVWILATSADTDVRNPSRAAAMAEKILKQDFPENPDILDTLAAAYAADGQFQKAVQTAQKAIELAITAGQKEKAGEISRRLQYYKIEKPWYDPPLQTK